MPAFVASSVVSITGQYSVVAYNISNNNHDSCVPNATYRWKLKGLVYELRATHPIKKGEQIFISYFDNLQTQHVQLGKKSYGCHLVSHVDAPVAPFLPQKSPPVIIAEKCWP